MKYLKRYEELIEEFSYKSYQYVGDTIRVDVIENGASPVFSMKSPHLENKLNAVQRNELDNILKKAMDEVIKYKDSDKKVKDYLGWGSI
ncbi:MAG: hypothetical protein ACM3UU_04060 [Ignavibacteriales bacterium]